MLIDLVVTSAIAAMVSLVFAWLLGWGRRDRDEFWPALLFLFVIIWMGSWALGRWIVPIGPTFQGAPLLTFAFIAFLIGFIVAAAVQRAHRPVAPPPAAPALGPAADVAFFGLFFWLAMVMLALALVAAYTLPR